MSEMGLAIVLEEATSADAEWLVDFERRIANPKPYGPPLNQADAVKAIAENTFYFIRIDGHRAGTAAYRSTAGGVYLSNIAVAPEFRRCGVAKQVVRAIIDECGPATQFSLVTHPENAPARRLYDSLGFVVCQRIENCFGDGEPRLKLVRNP